MKPKKKVKYVHVTSWALKPDKREKLRARYIEQILNWYIAKHIDEIRDKAFIAWERGEMNEEKEG